MNMTTNMMTTSILLTTAMLSAGPALAAKGWGVTGEQIDRFEGKVVDINCELTGDCPDNCGNGKRQLGVLKDDGTLVLVSKNQTAFSGGADDLVLFCGRQVEADGLYSENRGVKFFALQFIRPLEGEWQRADQFQENWARTNGVDAKSTEAQQWFRHDDRVKAIIERDGLLGLGLEQDAEFLQSRQ